MNALRKALSSDKESKDTTPAMTGTDSAAESRTAVDRLSTGGVNAVDDASTTGSGITGDHSIGHEVGRHSNQFDPKAATHSHTHLAHKTHETHHSHETEEVQRLKEHERHVTHVQHHVQPVKDTEHKPVVHHERAIPQTHVEERHVSTDQDKADFANLNTHEDTHTHAGKQRTVVDLGEKVNETVHHHVHNVVQPVVHKDTHEHHTIHTTIPTHHVTHEAPVVHQSVEHGMINKEDFLKGGGVLGSNISHDKADVHATGDCERHVDGVGEDLARKLHLGNTAQGSTTA